ncbi:MAG: tetratricopeptide repeat protein [Planctomycetota bacterium]|nr:MAG: tetratricopeptide repeat protein [Planctomycetota bacterium]
MFRLLFKPIYYLPGIGHILLGFSYRGVFFFFLFAISANGAFLVWVAHLENTPHQPLFWLFIFGAILIWFYASKEVWQITSYLYVEACQKKVEEKIHQALKAYVKNEFVLAKSILLSALKIYPFHPDIHFYLGVIAKKQGQDNQAIRHFQKCLLLDRTAKWKKAIENLYLFWENGSRFSP